MRLLASLILSISILHLAGEDAPLPQAATVKTLDRQRKDSAQKRVDELLKKKPVLYSGFATDLSKSTNISKTLNLRQPNRPQQDLTNIIREERTGRAKGYKIWAVSF